VCLWDDGGDSFRDYVAWGTSLLLWKNNSPQDGELEGYCLVRLEFKLTNGHTSSQANNQMNRDLGGVVRIERGTSKQKGFQCDVSLTDIPLSARERPDGDFYSVGNRI